MISHVSYELKNPLSHIHMYAETFMLGLPSEHEGTDTLKASLCFDIIDSATC